MGNLFAMSGHTNCGIFLASRKNYFIFRFYLHLPTENKDREAGQGGEGLS